MLRYIYDTETGAIRRQTAAYNPAVAVGTGQWHGIDRGGADHVSIMAPPCRALISIA